MKASIVFCPDDGIDAVLSHSRKKGGAIWLLIFQRSIQLIIIT